MGYEVKEPIINSPFEKPKQLLVHPGRRRAAAFGRATACHCVPSA